MTNNLGGNDGENIGDDHKENPRYNPPFIFEEVFI